MLAPLLFSFFLLELNPQALTWSLYATFRPAMLNRMETDTRLEFFLELARTNYYFEGRGNPWLNAYFQRRG